MITAALRSAIEKIPTREERLGGQTFKYVKLSEVLDLLDTFRSSNAPEPVKTMTKENIGGTFECPVCGKDSPHQHRADAIRWYSDHLDRFMTAVNDGEPKERFNWGGTYPHPKDPDAPFRFRQPGYQSLWETYCRFVEVGLIPERQPNAPEPNHVLIEVGLLIALEDDTKTLIADWNEELYKLSAGTKLYARVPLTSAPSVAVHLVAAPSHEGSGPATVGVDQDLDSIELEAMRRARRRVEATGGTVPMDCFWPKCSDRKRCEAFGSCVAKDQKANLDKIFPQQMTPDTSPLTHQEIFSAVHHHASEIVRLTAAVPVECHSAKPPAHTTAEDFDHFLAYSNLKDEPALKKAFFAGRGESVPEDHGVWICGDCGTSSPDRGKLGLGKCHLSDGKETLVLDGSFHVHKATNGKFHLGATTNCGLPPCGPPLKSSKQCICPGDYILKECPAKHPVEDAEVQSWPWPMCNGCGNEPSACTCDSERTSE